MGLLALYTQIGPWSIPTFRLTVGIAVVVSVLVGVYWQRARGRLVDVYLGGLVMGIIGARVFHVALNWDYFTENRDEMWVIGAGGLDWHGAVLGGLLGIGLMLWLVLRMMRLIGRKDDEHAVRLSFQQVVDGLTPALPLIGLGGWVGCLAAGCGYGKEVDTLANYPRWMASELVDVFGIVAPRYNTPYFGMALCGVGLLLVGLTVIWRRRSGAVVVSGRRFWWLLALLSAGMFVIGVYRADHTLAFWGVRGDQILDMVLGAWAAVVGVRVRPFKKGNANPLLNPSSARSQAHSADSPQAREETQNAAGASGLLDES
jgi:phosphatidylglycerol:prolipoprotein diacylglycerol transferase